MTENVGIDLKRRRDLGEAIFAFGERDLVDGEQAPLRAQLAVLDEHQRLQAIEEIREIVETALEDQRDRYPLIGARVEDRCSRCDRVEPDPGGLSDGVELQR